MKRIFALFMTSLMVAGFLTSVRAQSIQNPYYAEVDWKLWHENQSPVTLGGKTLAPRPESHRDYPADPTSVEAAAGLYMKFVSADYPGRRYSGLFNDGYDTGETYQAWHTSFPWSMAFDGGNRITVSDPSGGGGKPTNPRYILGDTLGVLNFDAFGIQFSNKSETPTGHELVETDTHLIEKDLYFKNILRTGPTYISYQTGSYPYDAFPALFPANFSGDQASFWQFGSYGKMMYAGAYLPMETKKKLLRNGVLPSTVFYNWKSTLPYKVPYDHMLRHRVSYACNGIRQEGFNVPSSFEYMAHFQNEYDANLHFANMVSQYKSMDATAPVTLIKTVEILQGSYNSKVVGASELKTLVALEHPAGGNRDVIVRVSTEDSYDLQDYPLTVRAKLLYGNKDTQVERESEHVWKVTVPWSDTIPEGRTDIIFVANNGVYDSNPAVVSVMRPFTHFVDRVGDTASGFQLVRTPSGLPQRTRIVPGETVSFDLRSEDKDGLPISFYLHEGADGALDGSRYVLETTTATPEGEHNVMVTAANERTGDSLNGASGKVWVQNTVAEISADTLRGAAPLTVAFDATASRDRDGSSLAYAWDFNDGATTGNVAATSHTFTTPGIYQVSVAATGSLGSDTNTVLVQVEPNTWGLVLNRGWTFGGTPALDPAAWSGAGGAYVISAPTTEDSSGHIKIVSQITSVPDFALPLMIEADFNYNSINHNQSYFDFFGHRMGLMLDRALMTAPPGESEDWDGNTKAELSSFAFQANYATSSTRWGKHLGATPADGEHYITLRVSLRDDPNHAGKMVIAGDAITEVGTYPIYLDNLDKHGSKLKLISQDGRFNIARFQVWTPTGSLAQPDMLVLDENDNRLWDNKRSWGLNYPWKTLASAEFGTVDAVNGSMAKTYTIHNRGKDTLNLTGTPAVQTYGWSRHPVTTQPAVTSLAPGASTTFTVTFNPNVPYSVFSDLWIPNDAHQGGAFRVILRGSNAEAKEINVEGNGLNIASGDTTPNETDHTDFGTQAVGQTLTRDFVVHNRGTMALALGTATISGSSDFTIVKQPRAAISDFGSALVSVRYAPTAAGSHAVTLTIPSDDSDEAAYTIALAGTGEAFAAPDISVSHEGTPVASASTLNLGSYSQSSEHYYETLVVSNSAGSLNITSAALTGADSNKFFVTVRPSPVVPGGRTTPVQIEFAPDAARSYSAVLTLYSDDADTPAYAITLNASGTANSILGLKGNGWEIENGDTTPELADGTDYGRFSDAHKDQLFTLRNPSTTSALSIGSIAFSGANAADFQITAPAIPASIPAGGSLELTVRLAPGGMGVRSAAMAINSNAPDSPFSVALRGEYAPPTLTVTHDGSPVAPASTLDFGSYALSSESYFETLAMSNSAGNLSISSITITGADAAFFTIPLPPTYPLVIAAGGTSSFDILFVPTTARAYAATLTLNSNDPNNSPYIITLNAAATTDPLLRLSGNDIAIENGDTTPSGADGTALGVAEPGQSLDQVFTLGNPALSTAVTIGSITFTGPAASDFEVLDPVPTSLAAGASNNIAVRFSSNVLGARNATLTINSNAEDAPFIVALSAIRTDWLKQDWSGTVPPKSSGFPLSTRWIDYDQDGDLDLFRFGNEAGGALTARCYKNTSGTLVEDTAAMANVVFSADNSKVTWSDYDQDGDMDFFIANYGIVSGKNLYRNDAGIFNLDTSSLFGDLIYTQAAWGDSDNDGDVDLNISGMVFDLGVGWQGHVESYQNQSASFTKSSDLPFGTYDAGHMEWFDADLDGDLDLLVFGSWVTTPPPWAPAIRIYENQNGVVSANILAEISGSWRVAVGDLDSDGDMDLVLMGTNPNIEIYWNDNGTFTQEDTGVPSLSFSGEIACGDMDNDGDLDLVVTGGGSAIEYRTRILVNNAGLFSIDPAMEWSDGLIGSSLNLVDVDNDGDLDFFTTGKNSTADEEVLFYNNPFTTPNEVPAAPAGLTYGASGNAVTFSWEDSSDDTTPTAALSYNIRVGTTANPDATAPGMAGDDGFRYQVKAGTIQRTDHLLNLPDGSYTVQIQAVDAAYAGGAWSAPLPVFVGSTPYNTWSSGISWGGADSSPGGDGDGDLVINYWEYAMDLDPTVFDASVFTAGITDFAGDGLDYFALDYRRNKLATELTWSLLASPDLPANAWTVWPVDNTKVWSETLDADVDGDGSAELMRYWILLGSEDVYFFRLGIE